MSERARPDTLMEQEANAIVDLLSIPGKRRVMVLVVTSEGEEGAIARAFSKGTTKLDCINFMAALGREYERIRAKSGVK